MLETELGSMVRAINLSADIPESRELHITLPIDVPIGPAEMVLVVSSQPSDHARTLGDLLNSEFFGMWADRMDMEDSISFAQHLRKEGWKRSA